MENLISNPYLDYTYSYGDRRLLVHKHYLYLFDHINGFSIYSCSFNVYNHLHESALTAIFLIKPNKSPYWFAFKSIDNAIDFCHIYRNKHSEKFWLKQWSTLVSPITIFHLVMIDTPAVCFGLDDLSI